MKQSISIIAGIVAIFSLIFLSCSGDQDTEFTPQNTGHIEFQYVPDVDALPIPSCMIVIISVYKNTYEYADDGTMVSVSVNNGNLSSTSLVTIGGVVILCLTSSFPGTVVVHVEVPELDLVADSKPIIFYENLCCNIQELFRNVITFAYFYG